MTQGSELNVSGPTGDDEVDPIAALLSERSELVRPNGYDPAQYAWEKAQGIRGSNGAVRLKELSGKHLRAINMHLAGSKGYDIAETLGMTEAWVSIVLNDPLAQREIRQRFVDVDNEMFAKATGVIDRGMDSEDTAIALRSAEMVWRSRGRFDKKEPVRTTAEDVVQRMLELAAEQGKASVTISASAGEGPTGEASSGGSGQPPVVYARRQVMPPTIEAEPEPELQPWHAGYKG